MRYINSRFTHLLTYLLILNDLGRMLRLKEVRLTGQKNFSLAAKLQKTQEENHRQEGRWTNFRA